MNRGGPFTTMSKQKNREKACKDCGTKVKSNMRYCEKYRPEKPAEGPIQIRITFVFPYRKSEKKTLVASQAVIAHTVRPDLDNMEKALLDTMTRLGFWKDDAQIFDKSTAKVWGPTYGVRIVYDELAEIRGYI